MADHQEMTIHPAAATGGGTGHGHGGDWWSTAVSCSPEQLPAFAAGWSADGNRSRSGANAASAESPGSNLTFQEPAAGVADQGAVVVPQTATGLAAGWNHPYYL